MKTLCIAPCGKKKIWDKNPCAGPTEAKYVYIGPYAQKCIIYAEKFYPSSWCILSAKHGFLFPDDIVPGPYDEIFNNESISVDELSKQAREKGLIKYEKIIVLAGKAYSERVKKVFDGKDIDEPLKGFRIGEKISKLQKAIERGVPL